MQLIHPCPECAGPVHIRMSTCPHCGEARPVRYVTRLASGFLSLVGGLTVTSTLSACYGGACAAGQCSDPEYIPTCDELSSEPEVDDADGDGYCLEYDCDETNPDINAALTGSSGACGVVDAVE